MIEPNETFQVTLSASASATIGLPPSTTVTITDDDDLTVANRASFREKASTHCNSCRWQTDATAVDQPEPGLSHAQNDESVDAGTSHRRCDRRRRVRRSIDGAVSRLRAGPTAARHQRHAACAAAFGRRRVRFRHNAGGWHRSKSIPVPGNQGLVQIDNLAAALGTNNSLHFVITQYVSSGQTVHANLVYATNKTGSWVFQTVAELGLPRTSLRTLMRALLFAGDRLAELSRTSRTPPILSTRPARRRTPGSATPPIAMASGTTQIVSQPSDNSGDAGLGGSVAIGPGDVVAIASFFVERDDSGADLFRLLMHTRQANGAFATETVASSPAGYVGSDGAFFTGFARNCSSTMWAGQNITFSDHASDHPASGGMQEYAGQIRHAIKFGGTWSINTVLQQTDPVHNQMVYPVAALSDL